MIRAFIFILFIFFSTNILAKEPEYSNSLNENIEYGWNIKSTSNLVDLGQSAIEIITLHKNGWILKCSIIYYPRRFSQLCWIL